MFENDKWISADYAIEDISLLDYNSDNCEKNDNCDDIQFMNIYLAFQDIYLNIPEEIIVSDKTQSIKYDFDTFINDIYESYITPSSREDTYKEIELQAIRDLLRSTLYINNKEIHRENSYVEIVKIMNKYYLTQREKYTILLLITQAVLASPYYYLSEQYEGLHLGELTTSDIIDGRRDMVIKFIINTSTNRLFITKYLRLFDIEDGNDITKKIFKLELNANLIKKKIKISIIDI